MRTLLLVMATCAWAQSGMDRPVVGYVTDAVGGWHAVEGIAGAFTVRAEAAESQEYGAATEFVSEQRDGTFYVVDALGGTVDILPESARVAALLEGATLFATEGELVLRRADSEVRLACGSVTRLRPMSREWVQVSTGDGEFLLRVTAGREALFALPPVPEVAQ